jgi:hypothetical protein
VLFEETAEYAGFGPEGLEKDEAILAVAIPPGADFKEWGKGSGVFSLRLNDNYRAHIQRPNVGDIWTALDLGTHKEMGHG